MPVKEFFTIFGMFLAIYCVIPYIRGIFAGTNKPHVFTWLIFAVVAGIVAAIQFSESAGPGKWVLIVNSLACFVVVALAIKYGERQIKRSDWVALGAALVAIPLWMATNNPVWAVLIAMAIEIFAYYPTLRKSWSKPHEEVAQTWLISGCMFLISVAALDQLKFTTAAYPAFVACLNFLLVAVLMARRRSMELSRS